MKKNQGLREVIDCLLARKGSQQYLLKDGSFVKNLHGFHYRHGASMTAMGAVPVLLYLAKQVLPNLVDTWQIKRCLFGRFQALKYRFM